MTPYLYLAAQVAVALLAAAVVLFLLVCAYAQTRDVNVAPRLLAALGAVLLTCATVGVAEAQESRPSGVYDYARSTLDRKVIVEPGGKIRSEPVSPRTGRSVQTERPVPAFPVGKNRPLTDRELAEIFSRPSANRTR